MKLFEHTEVERTLDPLPDLPPDVSIPDDISGIHPPTTTQRPAEGIRWMHWLAAIALLGVVGVVTAVLIRSDANDETPVNLMETYGTDNPVFVQGGAEPGTYEIIGTADTMRLYGTDNPTFVPEPTFMDLYGTDNPVFVVLPAEQTGEFMRLYGTDNPVFVPEPTYMDLYGTDNPVFVIETDDVDTGDVDTGEFMRIYGTDNPTIVEP